MPNVIRWGILGTGGIAALFAEGLRSVPGAELHAVASRTEATAAQFAELFRAPRSYGSYQALVADPAVDVVYVATPNAMHAEHCILALEAGKPVLCEKPFTLDADEARRVVAVARRRGLFCMEAMWMRFAPSVRDAMAVIDEGRIGDVRMATFELGMPFTFDAQHRVFQRALGGGALLDLGVYPLSLASRVFGAPTRIAAQATLGDTGVDEQLTVLLQYPGGRQAMIGASLRNPMANEAVIMGRRGYVKLQAPMYFPPAFVIKDVPPAGAARIKPGTALSRLKQSPVVRAVAARVRGSQGEVRVPRTVGNGYNHEAAEVVRCLRAGERESKVMPLDETVRIMETVDEIRRQFPGEESR
jgi:predicted dehydrogenase